MLLRLLVGLLKGLVLGGLAGWGLAHLGYAVPSAWIAYPAAVGLGLVLACIAGKPIWAKDARIEVGMKAAVAAVLAPLLLLAARTWLTLPLPIDPSVVGLESTTASLGMFSVTAYAAVAALLAGFFDADNDPGEAPAAGEASPKTAASKQRIAAGTDAGAEALAELDAADEPARRRAGK